MAVLVRFNGLPHDVDVVRLELVEDSAQCVEDGLNRVGLAQSFEEGQDGLEGDGSVQEVKHGFYREGTSKGGRIGRLAL